MFRVKNVSFDLHTHNHLIRLNQTTFSENDEHGYSKPLPPKQEHATYTYIHTHTHTHAHAHATPELTPGLTSALFARHLRPAAGRQGKSDRA